MDIPFGRITHAYSICEPATTKKQGPELAASSPLDRTARHSIADSSLAAYAKDLRLLARAGLTIPCTEAEVMKYLTTWRKKISPQTMHRRLAALRYFHPADPLKPDEYPFNSQELRAIMRGLRLGYYPLSAKAAKARLAPTIRKPDSAKPITRSTLAAMLDPMGINALDTRDRAILLLGFSAALRRSALTALNVADLIFDENVLVITIRSARGGESSNRRIAIPVIKSELCAARAVEAWVRKAGFDLMPIEEQSTAPLFPRFDRASDATPYRLDSAFVSCIVKRRIKAAGLDPSKYSGDSLRRGRLLDAAGGSL